MKTYIIKFKIGDKALMKKIKARNKPEAVKIFDEWVKPVIESIEEEVDFVDSTIDDLLKQFGIK